MAAFSSQYYHPFLVDSSCFSITPPINNYESSLEDQHQQPFINTTTLPHCFHQETCFSVTNQETSCVDQSSKVTISDTEPSVVKNQSPETSMVVQKLEKGEQVTQKVTPMVKKRKARNGSSPLSKV